MTLKARPLVRETATFRDDRLFIVACEDTFAPRQYFDLFEVPRVQIHVVPTLSEARRQGVKAAICNPCFELWLLLHREEENNCRHFAHCSAVEDALRASLGGYDKRRLQPGRFTRRSVADACARARRLDQSPPWTIPEGCSAQVHRLLEAIAAKAVPHQLPPEFRDLMG